jgi:hypothetical protein
MASRDNQLTEDQAQLAAGRDLANWATAVRRLQVSQVPDGVDNINVDGRRVVGGGKRFLPDRARLQLELLDEHRLGSGAVYLRYRTQT